MESAEGQRLIPDAGLSCIQRGASSRQGRLPVGVARSSCNSMQGLQCEGGCLWYSGQVGLCCYVPVRTVTARRAGTDHVYSKPSRQLKPNTGYTHSTLWRTLQ